MYIIDTRKDCHFFNSLGPPIERTQSTNVKKLPSDDMRFEYF